MLRVSRILRAVKWITVENTKFINFTDHDGDKASINLNHINNVHIGSQFYNQDNICIDLTNKNRFMVEPEDEDYDELLKIFGLD